MTTRLLPSIAAVLAAAAGATQRPLVDAVGACAVGATQRPHFAAALAHAAGATQRPLVDAVGACAVGATQRPLFAAALTHAAGATQRPPFATALAAAVAATQRSLGTAAAALALVLVAAPLPAQDSPATRPATQEPLPLLVTRDPGSAADALLYIRAGAVVDPVSGRVLQRQAVVVRDGVIERAGDEARVAMPAGATVIDLSGATVLPGLIDLHAHLTSDASLHGYSGLGRSAMRSAIYGVHAARRTLEAGFTTVRNLGAAGYGDVALRDAINDGEVLGPRMAVSGPALGITGGHCDNNLLPPEYAHRAEGVADGPWAVRARVRENAKYGVDVIKFCATGGVLSKGTQLGARQYTLEEMSALVDEAHTLGLRVAAHAHGTEGITTAIRAGVNTVDHASLLDDEAIRLAREHGTTFVMDIYVSDFILSEGEAAGILPESLEKEREVGAAQRDSFRRAHAAGVRIAFGTDAGVYPHGDNARQFAYMVRYGMTPMEAIRAATVHAAAVLGWEDRVGSIQPGRYADLIAVRGNPADDVRLLEDVGFVMKGGRVIVDRLSDRVAAGEAPMPRPAGTE